MRPRVVKTCVLLVLLFLGYVLYTKLYVRLHQATPRSTNSTNQVKTGLPEQLIIPSLQIDASIEYVGITVNGAMGAPKDPAHTAWFDLGPSPGEVGSAVINGHYGFKNGRPAVFDRLHVLKVGDTIIVRTKDGNEEVFAVRTIKNYAADDSTAEVFYSNDGKAHLNLITCEGIWDNNTKKYLGRLVVFADKV